MGGIALALAALAGLLCLASFTADSAGILAWFALAPLWVALFRFCRTWRFALLLCLVFAEIGIGCFLLLLTLEPWMSVFALLLPLAPATFGSLLWIPLRKDPGRMLIPLSAAGAASADLAISFTPIAGLLSPSGTQTAYPFLMAPASLLGASFLTFLIVAANGIIALLILKTDRGGGRLKAVVVWGVLLGAVVGASNIPRDVGPVIDIAVIEAGGGGASGRFGATGADASEETILAAYGVPVDLSREAARRGARLVVWPESYLNNDPLADRNMKREIERFVAGLGVTAIVTFNSNGKNLAVPVFPETGFSKPYEKHYPAEALGEKCSPGRSEPVYRAGWGEFGLLICYDMAYEDVARRLAVRGAKLIAVPTNSCRPVNAKFFSARAARLRAVENHVAIALSDCHGATALVGPRGETLEETSGSAQVMKRSLAFEGMISQRKRL
jgi:apolipoprotein N-acyltransferase